MAKARSDVERRGAVGKCLLGTDAFLDQKRCHVRVAVLACHKEKVRLRARVA